MKTSPPIAERVAGLDWQEIIEDLNNQASQVGPVGKREIAHARTLTAA